MKEERLWSAFKYFDTNDSGYITSDTVIDALKTNNGTVDESGLTTVFDSLKKTSKRMNFDEFKSLFSENFFKKGTI